MNRLNIIRRIEGAIGELEQIANRAIPPKKLHSTTYVFESYFKTLFPYAFSKELVTFKDDTGKEIPKLAYVVLNREYKPLGVGKHGDYVNYADYDCIIEEDLFNQILAEFNSEHYRYNKNNPEFLTLYNNHPWRTKKGFDDYLVLLNRLLEVLKS